MIVKVLMPFEKSKVFCFEYEGESLTRGDILVISGETGDRYGLALEEVSSCHPRRKGSGTVRKAYELDTIYFWLEFEKVILHSDIKLTKRALNTYRNTKGNSKISEELAKQKLKRNLMVSFRGDRVYVTNKLELNIKYGYMSIYYHNGIIVNIKLTNTSPKMSKGDKYTYYSKYLGVEGK